MMVRIHPPQQHMGFSTEFLTKFIGLFTLTMGLSMFVSRSMLLAIFDEVARRREVGYIMGVAMLMIGLVLVLGYNQWQGVPAALISLVSWLILTESLMFMFASRQKLQRYIETMHRPRIYWGITIAYLAIGLYLSYVGLVLL